MSYGLKFDSCTVLVCAGTCQVVYSCESQHVSRFESVIERTSRSEVEKQDGATLMQSTFPLNFSTTTIAIFSSR
jgi:hypothetical protein